MNNQVIPTKKNADGDEVPEDIVLSLPPEDDYDPAKVLLIVRLKVGNMKVRRETITPGSRLDTKKNAVSLKDFDTVTFYYYRAWLESGTFDTADVNYGMLTHLWGLSKKVRDQGFENYIIGKTMQKDLRLVTASFVKDVYRVADAGSELRMYVVDFFIDNPGDRCELEDLSSEGCRQFKDDVLEALLRSNDEWFEPKT